MIFIIYLFWGGGRGVNKFLLSYLIFFLLSCDLVALNLRITWCGGVVK
jgi:hypothetical protein